MDASTFVWAILLIILISIDLALVTRDAFK